MRQRYLVVRFYPESKLKEVLGVLLDNFVKVSGYRSSLLKEGVNVEAIVEDALIISVPRDLLDVLRTAVATSYVEDAAIASERVL